MSSVMDNLDLLKMLECPICLQNFEAPECLPCLHTFCAQCIREHITKTPIKTSGVVCPICRSSFPVQNDLNTILKKDFFKADILERLNASK